MTLAQNEMCLTDAVEDWWDNNIEKIKKKLGRERWINEFENAAHGNSDYLQKAVSNALATKKYDWDTYDIINQITQDDIAEVLANLAYQDLISDNEWRNTRWDSFEESYNEDNTNRSKLEARVARLEKLLTERSIGYGNNPSSAMQIWSLLRDNGPMTREQISSNIGTPLTPGGRLKKFVDNGLLTKDGNVYVANLDYKWDDIGIIPRTAQQELMNSVKNNAEAPVTKRSKRVQKAIRQEPKVKSNLPDIKECIEQLEWKLDRDFDADSVHVWNEDNKLYANVLICGKAYGDSYTERYKVLYSVNVKDYGEGHYTSIFDASKIIMQGDGVYDTSDLPSEQKSISVYTDFRGIESLTITYVMDYD